MKLELPFPLPSSLCTDPDLLCKTVYPRFCSGWLLCSATSQNVAQTLIMEKASGLLSNSSFTSFLLATVWGAPWAQPSWRTEWRALGGGSSLESLHSLHKCLKRVMPTLHLPCPSPSYTVYFVFSHPLGRGVLLGQWALSVLFSGMFWGWDQGSIPGGSSHSPAFCKCPLRAGGSHLLLAASLCSLLFVSLPHSLQLGFELRLDMHFLALWHCTGHLRNKSKRNSLGSGKNMTSCCDFLYFVLSLKLEKHPWPWGLLLFERWCMQIEKWCWQQALAFFDFVQVVLLT